MSLIEQLETIPGINSLIPSSFSSFEERDNDLILLLNFIPKERALISSHDKGTPAIYIYIYILFP